MILLRTFICEIKAFIEALQETHAFHGATLILEGRLIHVRVSTSDNCLE